MLSTRSMIRILAILSLTSATAAAQGPVPPMAHAPEGGRGGPGGRAAEMLLAHTGELGLSDAQVTRLAAIARRAEARRSALRASVDSARRRFTPGQQVDTAARRQFHQRMQGEMEKAREAARVDQRDALAVLTADQQSRAWDMVANRGRGARGAGMRGPGGRGMRMRQRLPHDDVPGFRERQPMHDQRPMRPRRVPPDSETQ